MRGLGRRRIVGSNKPWYIPSKHNVSKILQEKVAVELDQKRVCIFEAASIKLTAQRLAQKVFRIQGKSRLNQPVSKTLDIKFAIERTQIS